MATVVDDRTTEQKLTHVYGIVGRDSFLSGWGQAKDGYSRAAWACSPDADIRKLEAWVRNRGDMQYVNKINANTYRPPSGTTHYHIYVCEKDHPSQVGIIKSIAWR